MYFLLIGLSSFLIGVTAGFIYEKIDKKKRLDKEIDDMFKDKYNQNSQKEYFIDPRDF